MSVPGEWDLKNSLPLSPTTFNILLCLADGELHGYGIMLEVKERTGGEMVLGPSTLYSAIKRMLADRLIERSERLPDPEFEDERRRYYRLTEFGERVMFAEAERMESYVRQVRSKKRLWTPAPGGA